MKNRELCNFTHAELSYFTHEELALIPADLLRKVLDDDRPVPPSVVERIRELCEQENKKRKSKGLPPIKFASEDPKNAIELLKVLVSLAVHAEDIKNGFELILSGFFG